MSYQDELVNVVPFGSHVHWVTYDSSGEPENGTKNCAICAAENDAWDMLMADFNTSDKAEEWVQKQPAVKAYYQALPYEGWEYIEQISEVPEHRLPADQNQPEPIEG